MTTRPPQQPPAAPAPTTDQEVVQALLDEMAARLARARTQEEFGQVMGETVALAITHERARVVAFLTGKAQEAAQAAQRLRGAGAHAPAAQAHDAAQLLAGLAEVLGTPPGPMCPTCGGARVISSRVVTASGARATAPCPDCTAAPASGAPARPGLRSVPPEPAPPPEERH